jgi:hypothetical protein
MTDVQRVSVTYSVLLIGDRRPRLRAFGVTGLLFFVSSVGFLAGSEIGFGTLFGFSSVAVALYAGIKRGGILTAQFAVFASICWRAVFPPLIGYLRWDAGQWTIETIPARYDTIRSVQIFLGPKGELEWGIRHALLEGTLIALFVGSAIYDTGALYRHLRRDDPSTHRM